MVEPELANCKCPQCHRCRPETATCLDDEVHCERKCPGCSLFRKVFGKAPVFEVDHKVYFGCTTCNIITDRGKVLNLCKTCFSDSCGKDAESCRDYNFPLLGTEVRIYTKRGRGLGAGCILTTMEMDDAEANFKRWGPDKSLAHLTPEGAEGSVANR